MVKSKIPRASYDLILKHVQDGSLYSVSLTPWHKGCDREVYGKGDLSDVGEAIESWYYDELGEELCSYPHTSLSIRYSIGEEGLVIECDLENEESCDGWDDSELNDAVHGLLPAKVRKSIDPSNLMVELHISAEKGKGTMDNLSVHDLEAEITEDIGDQINKTGQQKIADLIVSWIKEHTDLGNDFSCHLSEGELKYQSNESVGFLAVPVEET